MCLSWRWLCGSVCRHRLGRRRIPIQVSFSDGCRDRDERIRLRVGNASDGPGGPSFSLADKRGAPMIVSMFYTSCQFVCPMLIDAIRATERKLGDSERKRLNVLLVSFDPAHDTVDVLSRTAARRQLDTLRWSLARTDDKNVRKLAAMLDIQYRALDNGDFNHSTVLILVDADGRIVGRSTDLAGADPAFVKLVKTTLAAGGH